MALHYCKIRFQLPDIDDTGVMFGYRTYIYQVRVEANNETEATEKAEKELIKVLKKMETTLDYQIVEIKCIEIPRTR